MKDVLVMTKLFGDPGDPKFGSWYEKGHHETDFLAKLAEEKNMPEIDAYHVLLTRKEWNEMEKAKKLYDVTVAYNALWRQPNEAT
jgi:hypothetical protein